MTEQSPPGNSFRAAVIRGERPPVLIEQKNPRLDGSGEALDGEIVSRSETRRGNHRGQDRHRLTEENAMLRHGGKAFSVEIVNLSSGGSMIRAEATPKLWELVELEFGEAASIEAAVRWVKGDCIGLEFAHETRIECEPEKRAELLLEVIQRSFPDVPVRLEPEAEESCFPTQQVLGNRSETRHPLIWRGEIHFDGDSHPVRLRNISPNGALIEVETDDPLGAEVVLDLGGAGQFHATVSWTQGDQAGLKFSELFDIACLAKARPQVTPDHWMKPSFLDSSADDSSPWDENWNRSSLGELRAELEGFLKR